MKFRDKPIGDLELVYGDFQVRRRDPKFGIRGTDVCKTVFSDEPVRKFSGRGHWFEVRVEDCCWGYMCLLGIGFTATDPAIYEEKSEDPLSPSSSQRTTTSGAEAPEMPARAFRIPRTYLAGYRRSVHWNQSQFSVKEVFQSLDPGKIFTIGALATLDGSLQIYINRSLILTFDPVDQGLEPLPTDEALYAVLDCVAIRKATILHRSVPPTKGEGGVDQALDESCDWKAFTPLLLPTLLNHVVPLTKDEGEIDQVDQVDRH